MFAQISLGIFDVRGFTITDFDSRIIFCLFDLGLDLCFGLDSRRSLNLSFDLSSRLLVFLHHRFLKAFDKCLFFCIDIRQCFIWLFSGFIIDVITLGDCSGLR